MTLSFKSLVADMKIVLENAVISERNQKVFDLFFSAYNGFCKNEKNGADYIFDLENQNDFSFLVSNGKISFNQIMDFENGTRFVMIEDDKTVIPVNAYRYIKRFIECNAIEVLNHVVRFPYFTYYQPLYKYLICALFKHKESEVNNTKTVIGFTEYNNINE